MRAGLLFALLLMAVSVNAHLLNMSKSSVIIADDGGVNVELALDLLVTAGSRESYWNWSQSADPLTVPAISEALAALPGAVALTANGEPVALTLDQVNFPKLPKEEFLDPLSWPRAELRLSGRLPGALASLASPVTLQIAYLDSFRFEEPIANTLTDEQNGRKQTRWLVTSQRSPGFLIDRPTAGSTGVPFEQATVTPAEKNAEARAVFKDLFVTGFRHIFPDGMDHLLFVAALFLGAASLAGLVGIITLFTVAHSLSLSMTALGWFSAPAAVVEPLILLSIMWIAVTNLLKRRQAHSGYLLVLFFGLIHGLGFASALRDIGLPTDFMLTGLLAFNVGVEAAQLAFLFILGALGLLLTKGLRDAKRWKQGGSVLVIVATAIIASTRFL